MGQRGRVGSLFSRAFFWIAWIWLDGVFDGRRHQAVHLFGLVALDEQRIPAATAEELFQFLVLDAREDCRIADLEAVEVQDRQNRAVGDRIEKFVGLPGGRQGARFGLAVADDAGDDEPGIVERGAEGVAERISEFAALVNGAGRRRRDVARNAAGEGELLEEPFHPGFVLADVGIDLAVAALEIGVGDQRRAAMAGTGDVDHVEIMQSDRPVQMDVDEILPRRRSPVSDHQRLDMRQRERLAQQRIRVEIDLTDREIVRGAPVGVKLPQFVRVQELPAPSRRRRRGCAGLALKRERSLSLCLSLRRGSARMRISSKLTSGTAIAGRPAPVAGLGPRGLSRSLRDRVKQARLGG